MKYLLAILLLFVLADPDRARQANEAYERGDYAAAEQGYRDAIRENPYDARLHFNLGNALARQGKNQEAVESYRRFRDMAGTAEERALADYNIGNVLGMEENWRDAVEQYISSLRQNPHDEDAVHNLELALQQLQQQQQQQDQQPQDGQDQQEGDDSSPQAGQQDQDDSSGDDSGQQPQPQPGEQDEDGSQQMTQPRPGDMTPEEAEQILNAIINREKDLIRDFLKDQAEPASDDEKDW